MHPPGIDHREFFYLCQKMVTDNGITGGDGPAGWDKVPSDILSHAANRECLLDTGKRNTFFVKVGDGLSGSEVGIVVYFFQVPVPFTALDLKPFDRSAGSKRAVFFRK